MTELSLNILDIANNSTRAGATLIEIGISADTKADKLTVSIRDNGSGMDETLLKKVTDPYSTTRTTRRVGLGIPLYKMAAEQTGGGLEIESELGKGTILTATFGLSSVDRAPLGSVGDTLMTLIGGTPDCEFTLDYRLDTNVYRFDTREIKELLGEDELSDGEVLLYLKAMIDENIENVNGGFII